jgi:hypothetical protein
VILWCSAAVDGQWLSDVAIGEVCFRIADVGVWWFWMLVALNAELLLSVLHDACLMLIVAFYSRATFFVWDCFLRCCFWWAYFANLALLVVAFDLGLLLLMAFDDGWLPLLAGRGIFGVILYCAVDSRGLFMLRLLCQIAGAWSGVIDIVLLQVCWCWWRLIQGCWCWLRSVV